MGFIDWLLDHRLDDASLREDHPDAKAFGDMGGFTEMGFLSWLIYLLVRKRRK